MAFGVSCAGCAFYSPSPEKEGRGQCRAHAPRLDENDGWLRTVWPMVQDSWWCGDHATIEPWEGEGERA